MFAQAGPGAIFPRDDQILCQTSRATDFYGFGVRVGIYFVWLQSYIANVSLPSEIAGALDTNTIFLLTLLVALIDCTMDGTLQPVDGLVLMHMCGGTIFGIFSLWGYRTRHYFDEGYRGIRHYGGFGTHSRLVVSMAVSVYGFWFWMWGVNGGISTEDPEVDEPNDPVCQELYTFMFSKVRADGGVRYFYIVICVGCMIYFGAMLLASTIAGWARLAKMVELARTRQWAMQTKLRYATGFKYRESTRIYKTLRILNLLWLIFSMLLIEFTLNYNHVSIVLGGTQYVQVHLPAQLIPLLIGIFGFVRISYLRFEQWRSPGSIEPSTVSTEAEPRPSRTFRFGVDVLKAFSPAMARQRTIKRHDPSDVDGMQKRRPWPIRYLVSWLPWLSLLTPFHAEPEVEKGVMPGGRVHPSTALQERHPERHRPSAERTRASVGGSTVHGDDQ